MSKLARCTGLNGLQCVNQIPTASGSRTNTLLNTAYTHKGGAGNNAYMLRYCAQEASAIDELYLFMDAHGGTIANITCECKIYNESSATIPASTVRATSTAVAIPSADDMWIKVTFGTPYTPTVGEYLWFVFYNTSSSPTVDYPQILLTNAYGVSFGVFTAISAALRGHTTTDGAQTGTAATAIALVKHANGAVVGYPFTKVNSGPYASTTRKRGIGVDGLVGSLDICGAVWNTTTSILGIQVFTGSNGPGTTPDSSWATGTDTNEVTDELVGRKHFDAVYRMNGGTDYRWVFTFSANSTIPGAMEIEDYASYSSVFDEVYGAGGLCYSTIDDGAGGWTDEKKYCPLIALAIDSLVAAGGAKYRPRMRRAA